MMYKYCSICGASLRKDKNNNLACTKCTFVNYQNPRPTATALVLYKNKLLFTKRAREPFQDWWDLPGGFIDKGETSEQCAIRELKEETGLDIEIEKLFGIYSGTYPSDFDPFDILSIVYIARCNTDKVGAEDDVSESRWFLKDEIPKKIAFDSNQDVIKDFLKLNLWN